MIRRKGRSKKAELRTADNYAVHSPEQLIGPPRNIARAIVAEIRRIKFEAGASFKFLAYGDPGNGKTSIAWMLAREISTSWDIEAVNGRNIDIETVRHWQHGANYGSLFGGWKVKLIHEADLISSVAQDLMLTYLDELPPRTAVIATSNQNVTALTERFQTRFRMVKIAGPSSIELARWLVTRWKVPEQHAHFIALGACGNVRQALLDAADFLTFKKSARRPKAPVVVVDVKRQDAAKKAWETMRAKQNGKAAA
jgi:replication-associated recombination protein RarA